MLTMKDASNILSWVVELALRQGPLYKSAQNGHDGYLWADKLPNRQHPHGRRVPVRNSDTVIQRRDRGRNVSTDPVKLRIQTFFSLSRHLSRRASCPDFDWTRFELADMLLIDKIWLLEDHRRVECREKVYLILWGWEPLDADGTKWATCCMARNQVSRTTSDQLKLFIIGHIHSLSTSYFLNAAQQ